MGNNSLSYGYDGLGIRRSMSRNGITYNYVMDVMNSANVLMELQGNVIQSYYIYGKGLISRIKPNNETEYYVSDYRGSVVAMVDDSEDAAVTHRYQYDSWGNLLLYEETDFNPFRFIGKLGVMYDDSTLYYMRERFYDPSIGRFISEDPIWNTNLYPYAENNPIMNIDPSGRSIAVDATNVAINRISAVKYGEEIATTGEVSVRKTATTLLPMYVSGVPGLVLSGIVALGEAAIDYYDRKIAEYDKILEQNKRDAAAFASQNQSYSGTSSKMTNVTNTFTIDPSVDQYFFKLWASWQVDYYSKLFGIDLSLSFVNGRCVVKANEVHQAISKNLLQKRAYSKKKAYMQEKMKRYEHLRKMLIERMTR